MLRASRNQEEVQDTQEPGKEEEKEGRFILLQKGNLKPDMCASKYLSQCENPDDLASNFIQTAKYTFWSFIPKNLWEQFHKKANVYFLFIAILSFISVLSPRSPLTSTLPLVFVLAVSAIKEGYEDWYRHKEDKKINQKKIEYFDTHDMVFKKKETQHVQVGDVVMTKQNEFFPADILLLQSSSPKGVAYIETANLDGETNLKVRKGITPTWELDAGDINRYAKNLAAVIKSEPPSAKMSDEDGWSGVMIGVSVGDPNINCNQTYPLKFNQLCLRACQLRNTKWTIGVVIFTGHETKVRQNSQKERFKRSNVDLIVDKMLYFIFLIQFVICTIAAIMYFSWLQVSTDFTQRWMLDTNTNATLAAYNFFTFIILIDILVPVSLWVSIEVVKFAQAWLITQDEKMFYADTPAQARTSNLNEELGQIDYVFTDKTGTLTQNKMVFHKCYVCAPKGRGKRFGPERMTGGEHLETPIDEFLTCLALCHSVIPEITPEGEIKYQSSSPDEKALVLAAREKGYHVLKRTVSDIEIAGINTDITILEVSINGEIRCFEVVVEIEFTSSRKRMSVVVKDPRDGRYKLLCKGADNIIKERQRSNSIELDDEAEQELQSFATEGLRTLCIAMRILGDREFFEWFREYSSIKCSDDLKTKNEKMKAICNRLEQNLRMLGFTGIEDKLQDGVPETIHMLHQGHMKCWMLTGDKMETAKNIGITCKLITPEMIPRLKQFDPKKQKNVSQETMKASLYNEIEKLSNQIREENRSDQGMLLSGSALELIFPTPVRNADGTEVDKNPEDLKFEEKLQKQVYDLCTMCNAVVCCRISPRQKAEIVKLVRRYEKNCITLAIGDGANDVAMIKAAHVGIGINGLEGMQAVMNSDYAIAQFRFLQNLLFVHGAWSYRRISILILYSFYKNVALSICQVWFGLYNGWSGQVYYDPWTTSAFNFAFTGVPVIALAILNRDYSYEDALKYPSLYSDGQENQTFNVPLFIDYFTEGFMHSALLFFISMILMPDFSSSDGKVVDLWMVSTTTYTACIYVVTFKLCLLTTTWNRITYGLVIFSIILWYFYIWCYTTFFFSLSPNMYGLSSRLLSSKSHWLVVFIIVCMSMLPDLAFEYIKKKRWPSRVEQMHLEKMKDK